MPDDPSVLNKPPLPDFRAVFDETPGMCLILDAAFHIVAQNEEHAKATFTTDKDVIGHSVFEVFPDNPNDSNAAGVSLVQESLLKVLKTRKADTMPVVRYDIQGETGPFKTRYWSVSSTPILGADGFVCWIVIRAMDVTDYVLSGVGKPG
jgi:PAS domain-containing protein